MSLCFNLLCSDIWDVIVEHLLTVEVAELCCVSLHTWAGTALKHQLEPPTILAKHFHLLNC